MLQATLLMKDAYDRAKLRHPAKTQDDWIEHAQQEVFDMLHEDAFQVTITTTVLLPSHSMSGICYSIRRFGMSSCTAL